MYRKTKLFCSLIMVISMLGCSSIYSEYYYPVPNQEYGWKNNQYVINIAGFFTYRCYDDNNEIQEYNLASSVYAYKVVDKKLYVISENRYIVVDKDNVCKVYIYCNSNKEINNQVNSVLDLDNEHCYSVDRYKIIYDKNVIKLNDYYEFSEEERKNLENINKEALEKHVLYEDENCMILSTYTSCSLFYNNDDGTKSNIIGDVCDFKIINNKLYVSGYGNNKSFDANNYAVIENNKVKVLNIYTKGIGDEDSSDDFYINSNITGLKYFSEFSKEEQEILKTLKNQFVLRDNF